MSTNVKIFYAFCSKKAVSLVDRAKMTEHTFMIIIAIIIGALAGFGAIAIRSLIKIISDFSFSGTGTLLQNMIDTPWYIIVIIPIIGGLLVGPLIHFFAPEAKGHGVPEVMQAVLLKGGLIRPRVALVKALASSITIGTGGSVGREGPIIQIGASLGSTVGQFFKMSGSRMKTLVGCGAAAGIAAAFNAPIAGALFAVEIILMDFAFVQFSPIVISSVMATVISHHYEGNFAAFQVPQYHLINPLELIFYAALGLLAGVASYVFIKVLYAFEDFFENKLKLPSYLQPAIGGLVIGIIALKFPEIMGVGYDSINDALHGRTVWYLALGLIFLKVIATSFTLGSGGSGGIFAPSLFMGAMLGCFFGYFVHTYFPSITASPGAYALVAMGGLVAGTTRAPITAIIIVFELTKDYEIILPLMITCIISAILSSKLSRESIYTLKLLLRNINLKEGTEINIMKSIFVRDVYTPAFEMIPETANFNEIVNKVISKRDPYFAVQNDNSDLVGMISIHDIKSFLFDGQDLQDIIIARDIAVKDFDKVTLEDNCQLVLDTLSRSGLSGLPVVDFKKSDKILGIIWRRDILKTYNQEVEKKDIALTFVDKLVRQNTTNDVHLVGGYSVSEIAIPDAFIGRSIKKLDIRAKYSVNILSIRQETKQGTQINAFPAPDYIIKKDDHLIIAGEIKMINLIKNLS
jgi:chloride channel protein, CIC family